MNLLVQLVEREAVVVVVVVVGEIVVGLPIVPAAVTPSLQDKRKGKRTKKVMSKKCTTTNREL